MKGNAKPRTGKIDDMVDMGKIETLKGVAPEVYERLVEVTRLEGRSCED